MKKVTFVLTSCDRMDLLKKTMDSFLKFNTYPIEKYIIIEDSGNMKLEPELNRLFGDFCEIIMNNPRMGQIRSIDKAYKHVETPYIFHCEEDWVFHRSNFIEDSIKILESDSNIIQVWLRDLWDTNGHPPEREIKTLSNILYRKMTTNFHSTWHGFSFNPGIKRLADYKKIGTYEPIGYEAEISQKYYSLGYYATILEESAVSHIGWDNSAQERIKKENRFKPKRLIGLLIPDKLKQLIKRQLNKK